MNSSTSSSEVSSETAWRRFAIFLLAVTAVAVVGIIAAAYVIDPYDTGRSRLFARDGVRPQGPRTANASRGRDPSYDSAIFGNSQIQLLSPERLNQRTGFNFLQLAVPATGPKEHFVLIDWFLKHRTGPVKALVVDSDETWCTSDPAMPNFRPFPFWLYAANPLEYAKGLMRYDILEELPRRLGYVFGKKPERARPDGYWDYEPNYLNLGYDTRPEIRARLEKPYYASEPTFERDPKEGQRTFPVADKLKELAGSLPPETALIVVHPARYKNYLPPPGTEEWYQDKACKMAMKAALSGHSRSAVVDWRIDRPENRNADYFFDLSHYRQPIAMAIEADIAKALQGLN
ncbi:hypothetical protein [Microvirga rosea]|uniref:hypothetical protein n=1 Tax=Microvirga rosea TaxID=2715425 RepID=UPI001D0B13B2|nr:hypothetical protein [Microvirga rosea]MCB8822601.1 hypothetical protein [Microvirga rosea]